MALDRWLQSFTESLAEMWSTLATQLPRLLIALVILAGGWIVALLLRLLVRQVVTRIEGFVRRRTGDEETREQRVATRLASAIVFWVTMLLFVAAAVEQLGLRAVSEGVAAIASYLPAVLGAVIIVLSAFLFGDFVKRGTGSAARASGLANSETPAGAGALGVP